MRTTLFVICSFLFPLVGCTGVGIHTPPSVDVATLSPAVGEASPVASNELRPEIPPQGSGTVVPPKVVHLKTRMIGFRWGPFYPSDDKLADIDNSIQKFGIAFTNRMGGPEGHLAIKTGFEWWNAKGKSSASGNSRDVELDQWSLPFSLVYNTTSLLEGSGGKLNLYAGGGFQLTSLYQQTRGNFGAPIYDYEAGWGFQVEAGLTLPLGKTLYIGGFARYEWVYPWNSNSTVGGVDELGGSSAGIEIGVRL